MKRDILKLLVALMVITMSGPALAADEAVISPVSDYVIGPGDVLDISVWKDEALTKMVTVLPDGKIAFPLIGQVEAAGKTLEVLHKELEVKLNRYVPDVSLSMVVAQVNSMLIYVIGRVNSPGRFVVNTNVDVLQALSMAGGLNPFARRSKIKIFRKQSGTTTIFPFDYDDLAKGENLTQNIMLQRGDVILVP